mgnify:CR=1 FL=1
MTTRSEAQQKAMKERTKTMNEWNENNKNLRYQYLPKNMEKMENTENYKPFMDVYGVMPFQVIEEQAGILHQKLVAGYEKGRKHKYRTDEGTLILNNDTFQGYNMYPYHKGSLQKEEAQKN